MAAEHATLANQLAPLATKLRESQGLVRPVSQVLLTCQSEAAEESARSARKAVLQWIERKSGRRLPTSAWDGENFDLVDVGAQRAEAVRLDDYWAARVDDADKDVARRTWVTEVALARRNSEVLFGTRLSSVTRGEDVPTGRSVPTFVREVAALVPFPIDGCPVRAEPWLVDSSAAVRSLAGLLVNPVRTHPVCVFSLPEGSDDPAATTIPVDLIVRRTMGAAHVAVLTSSASYELTRLVGKEFSVFLGAVRTYRPGLDLETSDPSEHPLALARRIEGWPGGPRAFGEMLVNGMLRSTVSNPNLEADLPPYSRVRQAAQERRRKALSEEGASDRDLLKLALEENDSLTQRLGEQVATSDGLLKLAEQERDEAKGRLRETEARINALKARVEHLESKLEQAGESAGREEIPDSFEDLKEWGKRHLGGSVVLHTRAIRNARKSHFEDVTLAYKALLVLRDAYVPMRRHGGAAARTAYEEALGNLHLEEAPCFSGTGARREGDTYFIEFGGRKRELDRHLKGSNSRDPRYGFRLYFFWDEETEQVVVGSLTNHLDTRIT